MDLAKIPERPRSDRAVPERGTWWSFGIEGPFCHHLLLPPFRHHPPLLLLLRLRLLIFGMFCGCNDRWGGWSGWGGVGWVV